jgi:hypothetical protein
MSSAQSEVFKCLLGATSILPAEGLEGPTGLARLSRSRGSRSGACTKCVPKDAAAMMSVLVRACSRAVAKSPPLPSR